MKLIGSQRDRLLLHFGRREKELFLHVLQLYPRVPPAHHRLSRSPLPDPSSQQLLEEALAEQRAEGQKLLTAVLGGPGPWAEQPNGWRLSLRTTQAEWLLQILNDIRVGSWVRLGSPEENQVDVADEEAALHLWAMEMAGAFQMSLLQALEHET